MYRCHTSGVAAYAALLNARITTVLSSFSENEDEQFLTTFLKMCHRQYKCSVSGQQDGIAADMARSASVRITCLQERSVETFAKGQVGWGRMV